MWLADSASRQSLSARLLLNVQSSSSSMHTRVCTTQAILQISMQCHYRLPYLGRALWKGTRGDTAFRRGLVRKTYEPGEMALPCSWGNKQKGWSPHQLGQRKHSPKQDCVASPHLAALPAERSVTLQVDGLENISQVRLRADHLKTIIHSALCVCRGDTT